jgi:hypothetical protein
MSQEALLVVFEARFGRSALYLAELRAPTFSTAVATPEADIHGFLRHGRFVHRYPAAVLEHKA